MLFIAAAAALSAPPAPPRNPVVAMVEARATVRIVSGVRLHLGQHDGRDGFVRRDTTTRSAGGAEPARLIEFE